LGVQVQTARREHVHYGGWSSAVERQRDTITESLV
jgi:hypothetical protein